MRKKATAARAAGAVEGGGCSLSRSLQKERFSRTVLLQLRPRQPCDIRHAGRCSVKRAHALPTRACLSPLLQEPGMRLQRNLQPPLLPHHCPRTAARSTCEYLAASHPQPESGLSSSLHRSPPCHAFKPSGDSCALCARAADLHGTSASMAHSMISGDCPSPSLVHPLPLLLA